MKDTKDIEEKVDEALGVIYESQGFFKYSATSSLPHTENVIGYGRSEEKAEISLFKRIFALAYRQRRRFFKAVDKEFDRDLGGAPVEWSYEPLKDGKTRITVTDSLGRTSSRVFKVLLEMEEYDEFEGEGADEVEEEA